MEFSIKKYYNIKNDVTNKEIVNTFLVDLEFYFDSFKEMLAKIKTNKEDFIYPQDCNLIAKKIKHWTIIMCIFLEKLTTNPVFLTNAETFLNNEKVCTIDTFNFFLKLFNEKLNINTDKREVVNTYCRMLDFHKGIIYKVNIEQLLKIDEHELSTSSSDSLIEMIIK